MTENTVSVYDGRTALGSLVERRQRWEAITTAGKSLGLYNTQAAAIAALGEEANGRCDPGAAT